MVAYNFKPAFGAAVSDGTRTLTMREPRSPRARHARVGDALQLSTRARTKNRRLLVEQPCCTLRATVILGPSGVVRVLDPVTDGSVKAQGIAMLLAQAEQGSPEAERWGNALAVLDGFPDYPALYVWHVENSRRFGPDGQGQMRRELIGWMS